MFELTIVFKNEEHTHRKKCLIYEGISLCADSPDIIEMVNEAKKEIAFKPTDIQIKISMTLL